MIAAWFKGGPLDGERKVVEARRLEVALPVRCNLWISEAEMPTNARVPERGVYVAEEDAVGRLRRRWDGSVDFKYIGPSAYEVVDLKGRPVSDRFDTIEAARQWVMGQRQLNPWALPPHVEIVWTTP